MGAYCYKHEVWSTECSCGCPLSADQRIDELTNALKQCKTLFNEIDYQFDFCEDHEKMCTEGRNIITEVLKDRTEE